MAAQILSNAHISLILNGKTISGFADEERPVEFPATDDLIDVKYGNDGSMYGMTKPMYGGEITIRLAPSSEATAWFVKERIKLKNAQTNGDPIPVYNGRFADDAQKREAQLAGGFLKRCADLPEAGQTFEVVIAFEKITGNIDGATFSPTPPD